MIVETKRTYEEGRLERREDRLFTLYGLSPAQYEEMFDAQHGKCAICQELPLDSPLTIDHDHKTLQVRGLLCGLCNSMLGMAKDSPARLFRAIGYLREATK